MITDKLFQELRIRFNTDPKRYEKQDYGVLLKLLAEILNDILSNKNLIQSQIEEFTAFKEFVEGEIQRLDSKIDLVNSTLDSKINSESSKLNIKINTVNSTLNSKIDFTTNTIDTKYEYEVNRIDQAIQNLYNDLANVATGAGEVIWQNEYHPEKNPIVKNGILINDLAEVEESIVEMEGEIEQQTLTL